MFSIQKRRFNPDDPFFEQGNLICRWLREQSPQYRETIEPNFDTESVDSSILCQIHGCSERLADLSRYEDHYASKHKNICQTCGKLLPSGHLLDIHINENHNPLFELLSTKSPMYECLVVGCSLMFTNPKLRKKHLIELHKYPSSFRFDRKPRKRVECKKVEEAMDTSQEVDSPSHRDTDTQSRFHYSYSIPQNFSFGHGVPRGFIRPRKPKRAKNHLTDTANNSSVPGNQVDIESVDMKELINVLDNS